jgi:predicted nucleotidyltransferase
MISPHDKGIAQRLREALLAAGVPLLELRVFGSRARGDAGVDSDLDVCLVMNELSPDILRAVDRVAWEVGFVSGRIISTVEYTRHQLEDSPLRSSPIVLAIRKEGVAI